MKESLKTQIPDDTGYSIEDLLNALPGLHSFTGCDSVSSMAGKGKATALKLMMTSSKFVTTFVHLGQFEDLQEADLESIEKFTWSPVWLITRKHQQCEIQDLLFEARKNFVGKSTSLQTHFEETLSTGKLSNQNLASMS